MNPFLRTVKSRVNITTGNTQFFPSGGGVIHESIAIYVRVSRKQQIRIIRNQRVPVVSEIELFIGFTSESLVNTN